MTEHRNREEAVNTQLAILISRYGVTADGVIAHPLWGVSNYDEYFNSEWESASRIESQKLGTIILIKKMQGKIDELQNYVNSCEAVIGQGEGSRDTNIRLP